MSLMSIVPLSAGCAQPNAPSAGCVSPACVELPLTRFRPDEIAFVGANEFDHSASIVVRDRNAWESAWAQLHRRLGGPPPPLPAVDFSTEMVLVLAIGARSTSGYSVRLTGASESGGAVTVDAVVSSPRADCITLQVITYPVDLVRMSRRSGTVTFRVTPGAPSCQ